MTWFLDRFDSPVGEILLVSDGARLCALDFGGCEARMHALMAKRGEERALEERDDPQGFSSRIRAYLDGDFSGLDEIPVSTGGTAFQQAVWAALREIPAGRTESYGVLAARLGRPKASRAVGYANSLNPVAIVVPCHRVVGANGSLTGYAGGLERKHWLLAHEGALAPEKAVPREPDLFG